MRDTCISSIGEVCWCGSPEGLKFTAKALFEAVVEAGPKVDWRSGPLHALSHRWLVRSQGRHAVCYSCECLWVIPWWYLFVLTVGCLLPGSGSGFCWMMTLLTRSTLPTQILPCRQRNGRSFIQKELVLGRTASRSWTDLPWRNSDVWDHAARRRSRLRCHMLEVWPNWKWESEEDWTASSMWDFEDLAQDVRRLRRGLTQIVPEFTKILNDSRSCCDDALARNAFEVKDIFVARKPRRHARQISEPHDVWALFDCVPGQHERQLDMHSFIVACTRKVSSGYFSFVSGPNAPDMAAIAARQEPLQHLSASAPILFDVGDFPSFRYRGRGSVSDNDRPLLGSPRIPLGPRVGKLDFTRHAGQWPGPTTARMAPRTIHA